MTCLECEKRMNSFDETDTHTLETGHRRYKVHGTGLILNVGAGGVRTWDDTKKRK